MQQRYRLLFIVLIGGLVGSWLGASLTSSHAQASQDEQWWIYYLSNTTGDYEIYRMRPDGSQPENLTQSPDTQDGFYFDYESAGLSLDGQWIYFSSLRNDNWSIFRMALDGSNLQQLTPDDSNELIGYDDSYRWSPDGEWFVYYARNANDVENKELSIYLMSPDGSQHHLLNPVTDPNCKIRFKSWSPDGQAMLLSHHCQNVVGSDISSTFYGFAYVDMSNFPDYTYYIIPTIYSYTVYEGWSADSRYLYFAMMERLYRFDVVSQIFRYVSPRQHIIYRTPTHFYGLRYPEQQGRLYRTDLATGAEEYLLPDVAGHQSIQCNDYARSDCVHEGGWLYIKTSLNDGRTALHQYHEQTGVIEELLIFDMAHKPWGKIIKIDDWVYATLADNTSQRVSTNH